MNPRIFIEPRHTAVHERIAFWLIKRDRITFKGRNTVERNGHSAARALNRHALHIHIQAVGHTEQNEIIKVSKLSVGIERRAAADIKAVIAVHTVEFGIDELGIAADCEYGGCVFHIKRIALIDRRFFFTQNKLACVFIHLIKRVEFFERDGALGRVNRIAF